MISPKDYTDITMNHTALIVRLPPKTHKELKKRGETLGVSMSNLTCMFVRRGLDELNPQTYRGAISQLFGFNIRELLEKAEKINNGND